MDGKFPSLGANSNGIPDGLAENIHCEHHVLDNTNDISSACGKMVSEENYSRKWDEDVANASPESLHCQGAVARMQEIPPEVASLSTSYASMAYSPDCQQIPSETTPEPIKKSNFPAYQHPSMEDLRDIPVGYIGRKESVANIYNSLNDQPSAAQKENVNSDNTVTKETLEMNNEMELVQDLLVDVCESPLIHDLSAESRAVDFAKSYDPVDNEIHEKERRQTTEAQESEVIILSDDSCSFVPNQEFQQKTVMEFVDPVIDGLSLNVKVLRETSCGMHKDSSSVGLHDATEVCSSTQDSYSTINPIRSNMHEQCNGYISCASLTMSNSSGNDESVSRQVVQHSSHRTSSEPAQSCKNVSTGKCMEIQTKNCTDNNTTLPKCLPGQHLKVDTEPNSASTSHKEQRLVCNLQNRNVPTINSLGSPTPVEISNNCIESEVSNLSSVQNSCKVVEKKETGELFMPDDKLSCSQNHCSFEPASSDANNTSLMTSNTDNETDTGQIITLNIMNVGTVSDDTPAHYVSQGQSQSLTDSSNPEAKVNSVSSLENTSKEITSEVNFGTPQTPTDFLETETAHVEPCKNFSTLFVQPECKIDPDFKSSLANLSNVGTSVRITKRVGLSFKKRKLLTMANAFSTTRKTLETAQGLQEHRFRKISRDFKKILVKAKKQQSPPLVEKRRKSNKNHIGQVFSASSGSQANHIQKALKTEEHNEEHENSPRSSMKDLHSNPSNTLLKMPSESQHNEADLTQSRKQISCEKQNRMKCLSTEINSDDSFELSLQSTVNSTGFRSRITNAFSIKNRRSRKMDVSLKASDQHPGELSDKDVGNKNPVCETNALSPIRKIDRSTQYSDEDYATAALNNDTRTVAHAVKSTKETKSYISCKYCCRSFRHISAYTVHQRIHTGEKPYRCECCGKNFAQLSKLKSHRNVHFRSVLLPCPCCGKELPEKRDLMAHFMTHVKASKWNNEPSQEGDKPDAPIISHSKRIICNAYDNKFPTGYLKKFHKHACDKLISCKTCGQEFQTSSQLVAHKKTHWPVKPYACSICAKGFDRLKALKKHSERHTGDRPFSCSHCLRAFGDLPALRLHQLSKLCNPKPPLNGDDCDLEGFLISNGVDGRVNTPMFFKCQICKGHYQKWCQYTLHLQTHTKSPSYLCFACGQSYEKDSVVDVHCRVCCQTSGEEVACGSLLSESLHSDSRKCTSLKDSPPADVYTVDAPNGNSLSSAGQLHKNSQTPSNLQSDLMPESSQLIRASTLSGNVSHDSHPPSSPTPSVMTCVSLNESQECVIISPRLRRFKCPRCGQRYKRYRALCLHMQTHAPTFKYVCGPCGHSFERWNKLWLHQKIHRRKGQGYTCSQCNVQFHFFSSYRMHMLNHSEERPYTCPLCCQTFARELDLHVHQCSLQQPSRKLQCDVCSRTFSNSTNLLKHNLLHNGAISHQCLQCNLSFPNNKSLHEHLNTHSPCVSLLPPLPSEPFTFLHNCNRCKSSFSTGDLLFAHQICHTRKLKKRVQSTQSHESTSGALGGTRSTNRSLLSTLDLDAIPKESLFKYPHPDKLYIPSHLLITSKRVPVINLVSADEDLSQEGSIEPSEQECPKISQENSENKFKNQPQVLESHGWSENFQGTTRHNSPTPFAETSVLLEGPAATVNTAENEIQGEIFECADCSEKLGSHRELFEHYFLHALGNTPF